MQNPSYNHNFSLSRNSVNSLDSIDEDTTSPKKSTIFKTGTLPVKGKFGGGERTEIIVVDGVGDNDGNRLRRGLRRVERGFHKRVEDFRDHKLRQKRLYEEDVEILEFG